MLPCHRCTTVQSADDCNQPPRASIPDTRWLAVLAGVYVVSAIGSSTVGRRAQRLQRIADKGATERWLTSILDVVYTRPPAPIESDRNTRLLMVLSSITGLALASVAGIGKRSRRLTSSDAIAHCIGVTLAAGGAALRIWSMACLGGYSSNYAAIQTGHRLIDRGPYRRIRHPAYVGALIQYAGTGVFLNNPWSVVGAVLVPALGRVPRILTEEALLGSNFGAEYQLYCSMTPRWIPQSFSLPWTSR
jgi:protein-S-isoprenylcysteine O-methyltransferase Ste14